MSVEPRKVMTLSVLLACETEDCVVVSTPRAV